MFGSVFKSKSIVSDHLPAIGVDRVHVVHVVDAAHLLFDRSGHGLFNGSRIGPGITGGNNGLAA